MAQAISEKIWVAIPVTTEQTSTTATQKGLTNRLRVKMHGADSEVLQSDRAERVFGVPLQTSISYASCTFSLSRNGEEFLHGQIPLVVFKSTHGNLENIFSDTGSESIVREIRAVFDSPTHSYGSKFNFSFGLQTPYEIGHVLLQYLNELPEPVIPLTYYERFCRPLRETQYRVSPVLKDEPLPLEDTIRGYQMLITELPTNNGHLFLYVLLVLAVFVDNHKLNKTKTANLAAIFQPGLLSHPLHVLPHMLRISQNVLIFLIDHRDKVLTNMPGTASSSISLVKPRVEPSEPTTSSPLEQRNTPPDWNLPSSGTTGVWTNFWTNTGDGSQRINSGQKRQYRDHLEAGVSSSSSSAAVQPTARPSELATNKHQEVHDFMAQRGSQSSSILTEEISEWLREGPQRSRDASIVWLDSNRHVPHFVVYELADFAEESKSDKTAPTTFGSASLLHLSATSNVVQKSEATSPTMETAVEHGEEGIVESVTPKRADSDESSEYYELPEEEDPYKHIPEEDSDSSKTIPATLLDVKPPKTTSLSMAPNAEHEKEVTVQSMAPDCADSSDSSEYYELPEHPPNLTREKLEGQPTMMSSETAVPTIDLQQNLTKRLGHYFGEHDEPRVEYSDTEISDISRLLQRLDPSWSKLPRVYIILRIIGCLHAMPTFVDVGFSDYNFPVTPRSLPPNLSPKARSDFVKTQAMVTTKSLNLEKREGGRHCFFRKNEYIPLKPEGFLGAGGFGQVDKVLSLISFKRYARKRVLRTAAFDGRNATAQKAFIKEIEILKRLSHWHVVEFVGSYTDHRYIAVLMEPIADMDLTAYLRRADQTKYRELRTFFGCLSRALEFLHEQNVRHKDIKPQNILFEAGRGVLFTDFGLALDFTEASRSTTMGMVNWMTPMYCAPEVAAEEPRSTSSDIYSLGIVFLEMIVVLKGHSVDYMKSYFGGNGSKNSVIRKNNEALHSLLVELENIAAVSDNMVLTWVEQMLKHNQKMRPTAASLATWCTLPDENGIRQFAGICCLSPDESHSEASDDYLDEVDEPSV
ncbi:unnamed protein product, partial [Aureobasidium uvarum]